MHPWLARLRHGLLKHALWQAHDLEQLAAGGGEPTLGDLRALRDTLLRLPDDEGRPVDALSLLALRADDPDAPFHRLGAGVRAHEAMAELRVALVEAQERLERAAEGEAEAKAAWADALRAVLELQPAFDRLCEAVEAAADTVG